MIEPMTRLSFIFLTAHKEACLAAIGQTKLLHIDIKELESTEQTRKTKTTLAQLSALTADTPHSGPLNPQLGTELFQQLQTQLIKIDRLQHEIDRMSQEQKHVAPFEQFDAQLFAQFEAEGWHTTFYQAREKDLYCFGPWDYWFPLHQHHHHWVVAVFSATEHPFPNLIRLRTPRNNSDELQQMVEDRVAQLNRSKGEVKQICEQTMPLFSYLESLQNDLTYQGALSSVADQQDLSTLLGYAPTHQVEALRRCAAEQGMVLLEEPVQQDQAPTLLRQNRFSRLFNPILSFIGVTPGYREPDANGIFLVFFSLFFAMLVGDAGYGLIMVFGTILYRQIAKPASAEIVPLFILLGSATSLWGALTGVWFGAPQLAELPFLKVLVVPELSGWSKQSDHLIIQLTFVIGWVQLSIAHLWQIFRTDSWSVRATELGWLGFISGLFELARYFVLQEPISVIGVPLLVSSLTLVMLFSEQKPGQPFYKGLLLGLANFPLNLLNGISHFSDLVSYIRLFAVGLATKEMAVTFNQLALDLGFDSVLAGLGAVLILLIGHWINIALAGIAVMVHGIRLNFLEFSKHLNLQWTGRAYQPFEYHQQP